MSTGFVKTVSAEHIVGSLHLRSQSHVFNLGLACGQRNGSALLKNAQL